MKNRGYTLIELLVSIAIFSIVMLFVTSAYLSLVAATRHARATSSLMTNLDSAVDYMARSIRTGTSYSCGISPGQGDCPGGGSTFTFTDENGNQLTFLVANGTLAQCKNIACSVSVASSLTDPAITISSLKFYVRGTGAYPGDTTQPNVVISVQGTAAVSGGAPTTFSLESAATERLIDL